MFYVNLPCCKLQFVDLIPYANVGGGAHDAPMKNGIEQNDFAPSRFKIISGRRGRRPLQKNIRPADASDRSRGPKDGRRLPVSVTYWPSGLPDKLQFEQQIAPVGYPTGASNCIAYSTMKVQPPGATSTLPAAAVTPASSGSSSFSPRTSSLPFKSMVRLRMEPLPVRA